MLEVNRFSEYPADPDPGLAELDVPQVIIGFPEAEQSNADLTTVSDTYEAEQAIIAAAQGESQFQGDGDDAGFDATEQAGHLPIAETAEETVPIAADLDPPDKPPLPPVQQGFPEGEDDREPQQEASSEPITEDAEMVQPLPTTSTESREVALGDTEARQDDSVTESITDSIDDAPDRVVESEVNPGIIREINFTEEPSYLDEASTLVAHQLHRDPVVKDDVANVMQAENWHNLCVFSEEDQLVGVATVEIPPDEPHAFLAFFVVDEAHRGRNLGGQLIAEVERFASAAGAASLLLEALSDPRVTDESQRRDPSTFFEHHGYEAYDEENPERRRKYL